MFVKKKKILTVKKIFSMFMQEIKHNLIFLKQGKAVDHAW